MSYPDKLVRGISDKNWIYYEYDECYPSESAFEFKDVGRDDSYKEVSINWVDDKCAIKEIINRRKENGKKQFKAGASILIRSKIDLHLQEFINEKKFSYERKPEPYNKHHGNLLLKSSHKRFERMVSATLCLHCVEAILTQLEE